MEGGVRRGLEWEDYIEAEREEKSEGGNVGGTANSKCHLGFLWKPALEAFIYAYISHL